ncbi:MAG: archaeal proteasome endopeptidase complex subunit alpha [Desulfurococcales archaeon]|nr:archaeal proteasome endopeptidase complex subunit alpha [Desulfurococcales archaeon]
MGLGVPPAAYDRATTIFSPEGDLYQVRYAFKAVEKGWTSLGARGKDSVIIAAEKRLISVLLDIDDIEKIYRVDDHIGVAFAGMGSDGRILISQAQIIAVRHRLLYGELSSVDYIARSIADIKQAYTQHAGVRPFGVSLIFAGVNPDGRVRLLKTDPGGQYFSYYAVAIGMGENYAVEVFKEEYKRDMEFEDLMKLVLKALFKARIETAVSDEERDKEKLLSKFHEYVELGYAKRDTMRFEKMGKDEIKEYIDKYYDYIANV